MKRGRRTKAEMMAEDTQNDWSLTTIRTATAINKLNVANMSIYRKTLKAVQGELSQETRQTVRSMVLDYGANAQQIDALSSEAYRAGRTFNEFLYRPSLPVVPNTRKGRSGLQAAAGRARRQVQGLAA